MQDILDCGSGINSCILWHALTSWSPECKSNMFNTFCYIKFAAGWILGAESTRETKYVKTAALFHEL